MYLKYSPIDWHASISNEYASLQLLRGRTDIPVPKALDLVSNNQNCYLITSREHGQPISHCIDFLNNTQLEILVGDIQRCLRLMRNLQRDAAKHGTISNKRGETCYGRIIAGIEYDEARGDFVGPFHSESEFNKLLQNVNIPDVIHRSDHRIVFTHGDINMRNILVDEKSGRLSGIVDWETAGWYPDYWECTKAYYITKLKWRWLSAVVDATFRDLGDFSGDLEIERKIWWYCF
jgi:aminoglycoside phosphotransferase